MNTPPPPKNKSALMSTMPDVTVHKNCKSRQNNFILDHTRKTLKWYSQNSILYAFICFWSVRKSLQCYLLSQEGKKRLEYIVSKIHTHIHNSAPIARDKIQIMPVNWMDKIILYTL